MNAVLLVLALALVPDEPQVIECILPPACTNEPPVTAFDSPTCADIEAGKRLHAALLEGDLSVLDEVRRRYEAAVTYRERDHLGSLLLAYLDDDTTVWNDLSAVAAVCVRLTEESEELAARAKRQGVEPSLLWWRSYNALGAIWNDPRARPILLQALASDNPTISEAGMLGLALQKDSSTLAAIEAALERLGDRASEAAMSLAHFQTEEADALAMKYLDDEWRQNYLEQRQP